MDNKHDNNELDIIASSHKKEEPVKRRAVRDLPSAPPAQIKKRQAKRDIPQDKSKQTIPLSQSPSATAPTPDDVPDKLITHGNQAPKLSEKMMLNAELKRKKAEKPEEPRPAAAPTPEKPKKEEPSLRQTLHDIYGDDNKKSRKIPRIEETDERKTGGKLFATAFVKVAAYIIFVIAASAILSYFGINIANDIFAFVKEDSLYNISVTENSTLDEIADTLHENSSIKYPAVFKLYVNFKNRNSETNVQFEPGEYEINTNLNYDEIIYKLKKKITRDIVRITIPEGLTADQIIDLFLEKGVGTREGFEEAISSSLIYEADYEFLKQLQEIERQGFANGRKYALEGYLFPDTYDFYTDSAETTVIKKLLDNFNVRFDDSYYKRMEDIGVNIDHIVNLASIVQAETKYESEFLTVASLYTNRLNAPTLFPRLESDSTYLYAFPERRSELTLEEMKQSDSPYSTYSHDGLPPSAICNPGLDAIIAALYPDATDANGNSHTYYYMVAKSDGFHIFTSTADEHAAAVASVRAQETAE